MANRFGKLSDLELADEAGRILASIAEDPLRFGLTEEQTLNMLAESAALSEFILQTELAEAALRAIITEKRDARQKLLGSLSYLTTRAYADPTLTDAEFASVGLAMRPVRRRRRAPEAPGALVAKVQTAASVALKWYRNGNDSRTLYRIEVLEGSAWRLLDTVTQTKYVHQNVDLTTRPCYRVQAQRGFNQRSRYSNEATVDAIAERSRLKVA